jgi:hypothetical protein
VKKWATIKKSWVSLSISEQPAPIKPIELHGKTSLKKYFEKIIRQHKKIFAGKNLIRYFSSTFMTGFVLTKTLFL